jgi:hypothetical protein
MFSASKGRGRRGRNHDDDNGGRSAGRVWCRICGRPVRSSLGEVCSAPRCHRAAMAQEDR